jgi:hypothetical protein
MKNKKALVLSLVMAALMAMPMMTFAQNNRSLFGYEKSGGSGDAKDEEGLELGGVTQHKDPTAPLGSGLLIMVAAGAGYAIYKKKED